MKDGIAVGGPVFIDDGKGRTLNNIHSSQDRGNRLDESCFAGAHLSIKCKYTPARISCQ